MSFLIPTKYDFIEFICKFKGHYTNSVNIEKMIADPELVLDTECERCHFGIKTWLDSEDPGFYMVHEIN